MMTVRSWQIGYATTISRDEPVRAGVYTLLLVQEQGGVGTRLTTTFYPILSKVPLAEKIRLLFI